ncbi:hypothetical protein BJF77_01290 [Kocuria sp. CNJ-770]|uniref:serine hydrolase n=1 Tax=Kocuria sp. CNJ-770 TaxID=1904964 RepID=UPI000963F229|nr:serine hydrolase [Kocuria sp. CNJ-770]OLT09138.1 hypothetical protein BJF77_01290 [Kocuria sp. CNJ-770]
MPDRRRPSTPLPPRGPAAGAAALTALLLITGCAAEPGAGTATDAGAVAAEPTLADDLEQLALGVPGELGLVLLGPDGNELASRAADRPFTSASFYKLFVAHAVLERVDRGELALDDPVPGSALTVGTALAAMISWSDNPSGAALGRWLGWAELEEFAHGHGFPATTFDPDTGDADRVAMTTTPADVAALLERLRRGELLSPASTALFRQLLEDQQLDYALPSGFSPGTAFAHKTGLLEDVSHDAGLLTLDGREHVVVVMTDGWAGYEDSRPWYRDTGAALETWLLDPARA